MWCKHSLTRTVQSDLRPRKRISQILDVRVHQNQYVARRDLRSLREASQIAHALDHNTYGTLKYKAITLIRFGCRAYIAKEKVWNVFNQPWLAWPRSVLGRGTNLIDMLCESWFGCELRWDVESCNVLGGTLRLRLLEAASLNRERAASLAWNGMKDDDGLWIVRPSYIENPM